MSGTVVGARNVLVKMTDAVPAPQSPQAPCSGWGDGFALGTEGEVGLRHGGSEALGGSRVWGCQHGLSVRGRTPPPGGVDLALWAWCTGQLVGEKGQHVCTPADVHGCFVGSVSFLGLGQRLGGAASTRDC